MTPIAVLTAIGLIGLAIAFVVLYRLPKWQVRQIPDPSEQWKCENEARRTLAQIFGGVALLAGLGLTATQVLDMKSHNQRTEKLDDAKLRSDQYSRAIEKAANTRVEIRVGGIYGLGQLAHVSHDDYWPIMELLATYIRHQAHRGPSGEGQEDVQAALRVVGWRDAEECDPEGAPHLDLSGTDLTGFDLGDAALANVELQGAILEETNFRGANLRKAKLWDRERAATLRNTRFQSADLRDVDFGALDVSQINDGDVEQANVNGVKPKAVHDAFILMRAVDIADDKAWHKLRNANESGPPSRLLSSPIGCRPPTELETAGP